MNNGEEKRDAASLAIGKNRPTKVYFLAVEDGKDYPKYQKLRWEICQIR